LWRADPPRSTGSCDWGGYSCRSADRSYRANCEFTTADAGSIARAGYSLCVRFAAAGIHPITAADRSLPSDGGFTGTGAYPSPRINYVPCAERRGPATTESYRAGRVRCAGTGA